MIALQHSIVARLLRDGSNTVSTCRHPGPCRTNRIRTIAASVFAGAALFSAMPATADTSLSIKAITWDVIGLDSNKPFTDGPTDFPLAVRVKNTGLETANNLAVKLMLDTGGNQHINVLGVDEITSPSLAAGQVADFYFVVQIDRPPGNQNMQTAGYYSVLGDPDTTKKYVVQATATNVPVPALTPDNRQLFVEKILSQNRNSVAPVLVVDDPSMPFLTGQIRTFTLFSDTATGYDQQETTINFPTDAIQILSVKSVYTDPDCGCILQNEDQFVEPLVPGANNFTTNKVYVDGCGWVNDFTDTDNYHKPNTTCTNDPLKMESETGKIGGTIVTTYKCLITDNIIDQVKLSYLVHDHSGSSFHYNFEADIFQLVPTNVLVVKSAPIPPVEAGTDFSYFISVCNDSNTTANDVMLTDTLPACVTFNESVPPPINPAASPLVWSIGTLAPGECADVEIMVTAGCTEGECVNRAEVDTVQLETDYEDNISTAPVTIVDTVLPDIDCPAGATLQCPADLSIEANGTATATDVCGVTITHSDSFADLCGNTGVLTRTWTATDDNGNVSTCNQVLTVVDTTLPVLSDVPDKTLECPGNFDPANTGEPTASDACGTVMVSHQDTAMSNECGNTGSITRTWMAVDECGNKTTTVQMITVVDTTDPTISDVPDASVECGTSTDPAITGEPTASDTCGAVTISHDDGAQTDMCGNTGSFVRTWTATDACGNTKTSLQTITIVDTTPPTIDDEPDAEVECGDSTEPAATGTPDGSDNCGAVTITHADGAQTDLCGNTGSFVRTWTATDGCGLTATSQQTITIVDNTGPDISDVPDITLECPANFDPTFTGEPTATDECGTVMVTHSDTGMSNGCGNTGTITRTWNAVDSCGNMSSSVQLIHVADNTPPTISDVPDTSIECNGSPDPAVTGEATGSDTCGTVEISFTDGMATDLCGNTGNLVRTWKATDQCGNIATSLQTITIVDTTPPVISDVPDATVECGTSTAPTVTGQPTGSDGCGTVTITPSDGPMTDLCGNTGSFLRTWTATDECGLTATSQQTITVTDNTAPVITCPANILAPAPVTGSCTVVNYPPVVTSDGCGTVQVSFNPPSGTCFECGTQTVVTATATDECGNVSTCTFTVTVEPCPVVGCGLTQGYWKNHPENWPVLSLKLGDRTYSQAELLQIYSLPPKKNALIKLAHQLIATKLNIANGASDLCIASTVEAADALIANRIVPPIGGGGLTNKQVGDLHGLLDSYNNGFLCVPHCEEFVPLQP